MLSRVHLNFKPTVSWASRLQQKMAVLNSSDTISFGTLPITLKGSPYYFVITLSNVYCRILICLGFMSNHEVFFILWQPLSQWWCGSWPSQHCWVSLPFPFKVIQRHSKSWRVPAQNGVGMSKKHMHFPVYCIMYILAQHGLTLRVPLTGESLKKTM